MKESTHVEMEKIGKIMIMRRSIHTFLRYYHCFTTAPVLLILPFSASVLLAEALSGSSPPLQAIHCRFNSFFHAVGFSCSSRFLSVLSITLSQPIFTSVFSLPFALTTLLIGKALIFQALSHQKKHLFPLPIPSIYRPLLVTQLCNSELLIVANVATFSLVFVFFNTMEEVFGFSTNDPFVLFATKAIFYSVLANAKIVCNLALVMAGMENCSGFKAIQKACLVSWAKTSVAISLNVPLNLGILAVEGLFRFRVVKDYKLTGKVGLSMAMEGLLIAYLHSMLIVLDTTASCLFLRSCHENCQTEHCAGKHYYQIESVKKDSCNGSRSSEIFEVVP